VGKLLASERIGEESAGSPAREGVSNWVLVDRMRRLGGRLH
jgi:hypothetical protein